jgi:hypothetical protein
MMKIFHGGKRRVVAVLATMLAVWAGVASGQVITGDLSPIEHPGYAGIASHFDIEDFAANGVSIYGGEVVIFCTDLAARSLDEDQLGFPYSLTPANSMLSVGSPDQLDVWGRYATPQDEAQALGMAMWLIDNFYYDYFVAPSSDASARQYAFQNVLWEIFGDGGTAAGLDFSTGNIIRSRFGPEGSTPEPELWGYMTDLLDAVANAPVGEGYTPNSEVQIALDSRTGYQDYLLLEASPVPVPEPGAGLLGVIAVVFGLVRRRR